MSPFAAYTRKRRMQLFGEWLGSANNKPLRVLDLGGSSEIWEFVERPLDITLLNLPGENRDRKKSRCHRFTYVEGDGCDVKAFGDQEFDLVFTNSVIEHVGDEEKQEAFAREVIRLGHRYWVQTPSKYFPIEAHCGMPFWWFYPASWRDRLIKRWREKLPDWTDMVEGTRVLELERLQQLFPNAKLKVERILGFPKSYILYTM
ncbi:methyltransferase domain-containing protein [Calothrix sp. PCC 7507]|uniref:methyltransferase domain-containing protein n=1 Tax=Calothrix sp. PCC 7507 TaxID=99598 RepID=UPI0005AAFA00|nr:class I SAM-dependent methyltransferase [Calothrix sp. PCC 7507]